MNRRVVLHVEDDAQFLDRLEDHLGHQEFRTLRASNYEDASELIESEAAIECAVIDMMLPRQRTTTRAGDNEVMDWGVKIARELKRKRPGCFILGTSKRASLHNEDRHFFDEFVPKAEEGRYFRGLSFAIRRHFGLTPKHPLTCFIVHGHDHATVKQLSTWLSMNTNFERIIILANEPGPSLSLIEKFEIHAADADAVFVLLTRDDRAISEAELHNLKAQSMPEAKINELRYRARQNVIFEAGYFFGRIGRTDGKVYLLYQDGLELPSDMIGLTYIDISSGISGSEKELQAQIAGYVH